MFYGGKYATDSCQKPTKSVVNTNAHSKRFYNKGYAKTKTQIRNTIKSSSCACVYGSNDLSCVREAAKQKKS